MAESFAVMCPPNFKNNGNFESKEEEISVPGTQPKTKTPPFCSIFRIIPAGKPGESQGRKKSG